MARTGVAIKKGWVLVILLLFALGGWIAQQFWFSTFLDTRAHRLDLLQSQNMARVQQIPRGGEVSETAAIVLPIQKKPINRSSVAELIMAGEYERALLVYQNTLQDYPDSIELTELLSMALLGRGAIEQAFTLMYEHRLFLTSAQESELLQLIEEQVARIELELAERKDVERLIQLFQFLISLHGDNPRYYLSLANWQWVAGDLSGAMNSLSGVRYDPEFAAEVAALESRMLNGSAAEVFVSTTQIPLLRTGEHFVVEVLLEQQFPAKLMIDTGATLTILDADIANRFGLVGQYETQELNLNTAGGAIDGTALTLSSLSLGSRNLENVKVGVIPMSQFQFDGLLGMNVLSRFEFSIDQQNGILNLR